MKTKVSHEIFILSLCDVLSFCRIFNDWYKNFRKNGKSYNYKVKQLNQHFFRILLTVF